MSKFDDFDKILSDFNKVEERFFLTDIREFAAQNPEVVIRTYGLLLKTEKLNIQLKYLLFKSIGQLKFKEFVPMVRESIDHEDKIRLIGEAINSLVLMGTLPAFKVAVDFTMKHKDAEYADRLEKSIRTVFTKNPLLFHFDIFYRNRGEINGADKSSQFLVENLPEEYIKDLLPALSSKYYKIRFEMLRLLKHRPNALYYPNIYHYFKENYQVVDEIFFLMLAEALVLNASVSKARTRIFQSLKTHVSELKGVKKILFCITLLKLNTKELIHFIASVYHNLNQDRKMLVLENFEPREFLSYMNFVRELIKEENNEILLAKIVEILCRSNDFQYLFQTLDTEKGVRKAKILNMILDVVDRGEVEIDGFLRAYVRPNQDPQILHLSLGYLLKTTADIDFDLIQTIFFSGVPQEIKVLVIRNVNKFDNHHQKRFMENIFKDISVISGFRKDFLLSLLGVLNEKYFEEDMEEKILNRILVMMEEAQFEELVNFVYFFDRYEINNTKDSQLIIDELRLIQNTLLKSANDDNLVKMIHMLIRGIEKRMMLKK